MIWDLLFKERLLCKLRSRLQPRYPFLNGATSEEQKAEKERLVDDLRRRLQKELEGKEAKNPKDSKKSKEPLRDCEVPIAFLFSFSSVIIVFFSISSGVPDCAVPD